MKTNLTIKDLILLEKALRKNTHPETIKRVWGHIYPEQLAQFLDHTTVVNYLKENRYKPSTAVVAR